MPTTYNNKGAAKYIVIYLMLYSCGESSTQKIIVSDTVCDPGDAKACTCAGGYQGGQVCTYDGSRWEQCKCNDLDLGNENNNTEGQEANDNDLGCINELEVHDIENLENEGAETEGNIEPSTIKQAPIGLLKPSFPWVFNIESNISSGPVGKIVIDNENNIYLHARSTQSMMLFKFDSQGKICNDFPSVFDQAESRWANDIAISNSNHIWVSGGFNQKLALWHMDTDGLLIGENPYFWEKPDYQSFATGIAIDNTNNIWCIGKISTILGTTGIGLWKFSEIGTLLPGFPIIHEIADTLWEVRGLQIDSNNELIAIGTRRIYPDVGDSLSIWKFTSEGQIKQNFPVLWPSEPIDSRENTNGYAIYIAKDKSIWATGITQKRHTNEMRPIIFHIDENGETYENFPLIIENNSILLNGTIFLHSITIDNVGNIWTTGDTRTNVGNGMILLKIDQNRNILAGSLIFKYSNNDAGRGILIDKNNQLWISGSIGRPNTQIASLAIWLFD